MRRKYGSHPRAMGTMARRLELIRDNGLWTLEDAVYRLTGMPSEVYGLPMIGKLKEGLNADITVFDYKNVRPTPITTIRSAKTTGSNTSS